MEFPIPSLSSGYIYIFYVGVILLGPSSKGCYACSLCWCTGNHNCFETSNFNVDSLQVWEGCIW